MGIYISTYIAIEFLRCGDTTKLILRESWGLAYHPAREVTYIPPQSVGKVGLETTVREIDPRLIERG